MIRADEMSAKMQRAAISSFAGICAFGDSFAIVFGEADPPFNFPQKQLSIKEHATR
jgi:hypothetical protein